MSNKNLLNENTVRRFMKLAEIEPLTEQFVEKITEASVVQEQRPKDDDDKKPARPKDKPPRPKKEAMHDRVDDDDKMMPDGKMDEEMHGGMTDKDDMGKDRDVEKLEAAMSGAVEGLDEDMDEGMLEEELADLLAELDLDEVNYQDEDEDEEEMEMEDEEELDLEDPADEPAAGPLGMDPEELRDMLKDVVLDALKDLVDSGDLDISMDEPDEVDVESDDEEDEDEDEDMDMAMTGEGPVEEEMVNEVARRVMRRLVNSRR